MNCGVFDPLKVQNMSSGLYFPAVISAVFACTKVFDTFTKLFFFVFPLLVPQAKTFWQIRVTCRKPLITNECGLVLLFVHLKSMIYWRIHAIKRCIARQFLHPCLPDILFIWQCESMTLPIFQRIRYWTAAVKNICHFCKFGLLFTLVSYKMEQVDYCIHVPSLFAHSHAHIHLGHSHCFGWWLLRAWLCSHRGFANSFP